MGNQPSHHIAVETEDPNGEESLERIGALWPVDGKSEKSPKFSGVLNLGFMKSRIVIFKNDNEGED